MKEHLPSKPNNACLLEDQILAWHAGELDPTEAELVASHIADCRSCADLEQVLLLEEQEVVNLFTTLDPAPESLPERSAAFARLTATINSAALLVPDAAPDSLFQAQKALEAEQQTRQRHFWDPWRLQFQARQFARIFKMQISIVPRSVWWASALVILGGWLLSVVSNWAIPGAAVGAASVLNLFSTISAGVGVAMLYGEEHDPTYELTISTPTSIRYVLFSRFLLVLGYNALLSLISSIGIVGLLGGNLWTVVSLWLGPMLLVASFAMLLAILIGSGIALLGSILLEASQTLHTKLVYFMPVI
ncbi:MAG TPA: zf-HC2 domain-containing protein, partial [Ktedonobacteraceae bacterium]|nr:zf-HC2 domain-containing protein [Ktedonobacteraceae bacterium]